MTSSSLSVAMVGFSASARASSARIWRKVQPSLKRTAASVSSPRTILSSRRIGVVPAADLVAAGADLARLAGPAEPLVEQARRRLHAGADPGLGDLARRPAGLDRQLDGLARRAPAAGSATTRPRRRCRHRGERRPGQQEATESHRTRSSRPRQALKPRRLSTSWRLMIMGACSTQISIDGVVPARRPGRDPRARRRRRATSCRASSPTTSLTLGAGAGAPGRLLLGEGPPAGQLRRLAAGRRRIPARLPGRRCSRRR